LGEPAAQELELREALDRSHAEAREALLRRQLSDARARFARSQSNALLAPG